MMRWSAFSTILFISVANAAEPAADYFENEIRPLLVEQCQQCHDAKKAKGGLRLTSRAEMLKGGDSGPAVLPGKPKESLLIQAIQYQGGDGLRMPPKGKLPDAAIAKLTKWVADGAVWTDAGAAADADKTFKITDEQRKFWAFQPVTKPAVPVVKNAAWCQLDIDRFILAKIEAAGLAPAPAADKRTLIRRVTFDLTGLPPTPSEIQHFLADQSLNAFETVVDRLLASPAYGERWGRHWLDVARYADSRDSRGQGNDIDILEAWHYRDWVIRALNKDLPYDQFVQMQIAGDLMPPAEPGGINADGLTATGLLTIGEWGTGDADKEKMVTDIVNDQIDVVTRSFLGLTVGCARCHDHKFDPVSQKDYYSLAGIFFSSKILPGPGAKTNGSPMLRTPLISPAETAERARITGQINSLSAAVTAKRRDAAAAAAKALLPKTETYAAAAWEYATAGKKSAVEDHAKAAGLRPDLLSRWAEALAPPAYQTLATAAPDAYGAKGLLVWKRTADSPAAMLNTTAKELAVLTFKLPPKSVSVHPGPKSGVAAVWTAPAAASVSVTGSVADADNTCGDGVVWRLVANGRVLKEGEIDNGGSAKVGGDAPLTADVAPGDRLELQILPKAAYECDSTVIDLVVTDAAGKRDWALARDAHGPPALNPFPALGGRTPVWQFADMADTKAIPPALAALPAVGKTADRPTALAKIAEFAKTFAATDAASPFHPRPGELPDSPEVAALQAEIDALKARPMPAVANVLAIQEGGIPQSMFPGVQDVPVHIRGSYTRLEKDRVPRRFPEILAGADQKPLSTVTKGSGRKELADFVAGPANPLTARVMVNRVWAWHFGDGLVRTPSNFGKLGDRPTHPELLDHLATAFVADGWSLKKLHKRILLSAAYRQSSVAAGDAAAKDADNRLLTRANLKRLEAEALRDSLLAAAGTLDPTPGGVSFTDFNSPRRTVYLRTVRSDKSNFQSLFDAADPETPTEKRTVSTVAPQALFLMNHPFALAQAKAFAARVQSLPGDDAAKLTAAYETLYGRPPTADEQRVTLEYLKTAGWEDLSRVLMCANEFAYVR